MSLPGCILDLPFSASFRTTGAWPVPEGHERSQPMDLIGQEVVHHVFGTGKIRSQSGSTITVSFASGQRNFSYPDSFLSFLQFTNKQLNRQAIQLAEEKQSEAEAQKHLQTQEAQTRILNARSQKENKGVIVNPYPSVPDFCSAYIQALKTEISIVRQTGGKHLHLSDGRQLKREGMWYTYVFETEDELNYPDETQITIWRGPSKILGKILSCESFTVYLASEADLGREVDSLDISSESWYLLQSLADRLNELQQTRSSLVKSLVCDGYRFIRHGSASIQTGQQTAVDLSLAQPITFVWGPPGTGKTQTLAKIALEHIRMGRRVLMLSYSNVSVDGALLRVKSLWDGLQPGEIVRYGYPKNQEILDHPFLSSYQLALCTHPGLQNEQKALIEQRKAADKSSPARIQAEKRLGEIRRLLKTEESRTLQTCKFVATTVSKAVVDPAVRKASFDVVIFDEASMALIPQIVYGASLAKQHFVCMGDFRQLPPIVQSGQQSILNADLFQYCGISQAVDQRCSHQWLCMLDVQYRMHPAIADFASQTIYGGLLKSAQDMADRRSGIVSAAPLPGRPIQVVDLSDTMSVCLKTADASRVNVLSALMTFSLALEAALSHDVGIITPYHAQARLLHAMVRDAAGRCQLHPITCATVHQFQGSERDVILYDAVDCYRMTHPGVLLTSTANRYADRLFNVALTRARGKFIAVANAAYMRNKNLSEPLMFPTLLNRWRREAPLPADLIRPNPKLSPLGFSFLTEEEAEKALLLDLQQAKREIRLDLPDPPADPSGLVKLAAALRQALERGVKVIVRAESKAGLPDPLKKLARENSSAVNPILLIDKTVTWFGMPESGAHFKSEGRVLPVHCRPHIRLEGKRTARALYSLLNLSNTLDQSKTVEKAPDGSALTSRFTSYVVAHKKCPVCGSPMQLKRSRQKGTFFLGCSRYPACKTMERIDPDFVEEYLYQDKKHQGIRCPRCRCSLEAKTGQFGIYVQCCGAQPHRYSLDEI